MIKLFTYLLKFFKYLPQILSILKGLNVLLSMLKNEEKQNKEQQKPADVNHKTENGQENQNPEVNSTKLILDEKKLNYLENKSYFLANVGTLKEFESLSEEIKTLSPDVFRKQFPKVIIEKNKKIVSETYEEKATKVIDENHQQRKNELINKVTFIVNKCGTSSDFERLPDEVRAMNPALFKEKSQNCRF
jgi:hypothetical protein